VITFGISLICVYLGKFMGQFVGKYADILGGDVLILIGTKILLQHLGIIGEF
ncbi:manganese efflux pump, partial [Veillonella atypica]|uniref:manganese efflux pump n=1 Tax=Veillonella atypica TaxID=39777 RepID=UPI0030B8D85B